MRDGLPRVNANGTGYVLANGVAVGGRFLRALSFHAPEGLAAVEDESGAYHIDVNGAARYPKRYLETFGFYGGAATARDERGYLHVGVHGEPLHERRFSWAGNFQDGLCAVEDVTGFYHVTVDGVPAYTARYAYVGDFVRGIAAVRTSASALHIRRDGTRLHDATFRSAGVFHKGIAVVEDERGAFHVALDGRPVHAHRLRSAEPFYNGVALCTHQDGRQIRLRESGYYTYLASSGGEIALDEIRSRITGGARVGILLRHAERQEIRGGWGDDVPLTPLGVRQATRLGEKLGGLLAKRVFTSPVGRCVETARHLARGAGGEQDPVATSLLGAPGPFADPGRSSEVKVQPHEFGDYATLYLNCGRAPGMYPLEEACRRLLDGVCEHLEAGLTALVTHDLFVAGALAFQGLKRPTRADWADYLEGLCVVVEPQGQPEWRHFRGLREIGAC